MLDWWLVLLIFIACLFVFNAIFIFVYTYRQGKVKGRFDQIEASADATQKELDDFIDGL